MSNTQYRYLLQICRKTGYVDSAVLSRPLRGELEKFRLPLDDAVDDAEGGPTDELPSARCLLKSNCRWKVKSSMEEAAAIFSSSDRGDCRSWAGGEVVGDGGVLRITSVCTRRASATAAS